PDWLKMKNADAPAVKREAEEDWAGRGGDNRQDTWKRTTSSSINVHRLLAPAKGATTTTTCLPTALRLAASLKSALAVERRGCGRWPSATMRTAPRLTAMLQRAGRRWLHSRRAGGGSRNIERGDALPTRSPQHSDCVMRINEGSRSPALAQDKAGLSFRRCDIQRFDHRTRLLATRLSRKCESRFR